MPRTFIISENQFKLLIKYLIEKRLNEDVETQQVYMSQDNQQHNGNGVKNFNVSQPDPYYAPRDNTRYVPPSIAPKKPNVPTNTPEQAVQKMTTRKTGEKVPLPKIGRLGVKSYMNNCAATTTDSYGFKEMSNDRFKEKHQEYGFEQIPRTNYKPKPGDVIQLHRDSLGSRPHHMGMATDTNRVHHAQGRFGVKGIKNNPFYKDSIGNGWVNRGDTTEFTPYRMKNK